MDVQQGQVSCAGHPETKCLLENTGKEQSEDSAWGHVSVCG